MLISEQEIEEIREFILELNEKKSSVVIVEGKRDAAALRRLGVTGKILEFHKFGGLIKFTDFVTRYENIIVMLDSDKKGRHLTKEIFRLLQRRTKVDLSFKRKLRKISKGKIMFIEQLVCYESQQM